MPKKVKLTSKEKREKIKDKTLLSQEEANSLEQMIEKKGDEKMDISQFKEFLMNEKIDPSEIKELLNSNEQNLKIISSPSLKKINAPQRNPITLERDIITGAMSINVDNSNKENGNEEGFRYIPNNKDSKEPKYTSNYGEVMGVTSRKEIEKDSSKGGFQKMEVRFESSIQNTNPMQENFEKYSPVGRLDKEKKIKKDPFERKEIKYTPEKY